MAGGDEFTQSFYKNKDNEIYKLCSLRCIWPLTKASIFSFRATSHATSHLASTMPTRLLAMEFRSCPRTFTCTVPHSLRRARVFFCFALLCFNAHIYFVFWVRYCVPWISHRKDIICKSHMANTLRHRKRNRQMLACARANEHRYDEVHCAEKINELIFLWFSLLYFVRDDPHTHTSWVHIKVIIRNCCGRKLCAAIYHNVAARRRSRHQSTINRTDGLLLFWADFLSSFYSAFHHIFSRFHAFSVSGVWFDAIEFNFPLLFQRHHC